MLHPTNRAIGILVTIGGLTLTLAVSAPIGIATADGSFLVDRSAVRDNATLFPGTVVETDTVGTVLRMEDGARFRLGSLSRGRVFQERLVLERGESLIEQGGRFRVEAADLRIVPSTAGVAARVAVASGRWVSVAVTSGDVDVLNASGTLLAKVHSGRALEFGPEDSGAAPPFTVTGCLTTLDGRYYLKDDTASVTFELIGADLGANAGRRIEVTGAESPSANVIRVLRVKTLSETCVAAARKSARNGTTTKAVIAGVAIAGAVTGTTVGLIGEDEKEKPKPPISR